MRIKKFRHQVFQLFPSSVSNVTATLTWFLLIKRNTTHKVAKINSEFPATTWETLLFSTQFITPQKASNKSESEQRGLSEGHAAVRCLYRSPQTEARKITTDFDTSLTWEPPANPKAASRSVTAGAAETPSPLVASTSMSQCRQVLTTAGNRGSGMGGKSRGKSKQEQPMPGLPGNTIKLQPLSPSAVVHDKEGGYSYQLQRMYKNST